ncbi:MAG TPA: hypothetical protein VFR21_12785 [Bradyrhizobium sp.]|nr:hypothetical protein [Bradyrhizobium sp.]
MVDKADDPIAMWQQMVGEMQKGFHAFNQLSGPASRDATDQTGSPGGAQKQLADLMESYFAGLNLPSRAQLSSMADRLQAIESQLADIKGLLHEALTSSKAVEEDSGTAKSSPARPLQAIESQLADIKGLLHEALMSSKAAEEDSGVAKSSPARPRPKRPGSAKSDK